MGCELKIFKKVRLRKPVLVAAWPGMGYVALQAASYLREALDAKIMASLEADDFFFLDNIFIKDNIIRDITIPKSQFYYWKNPNKKFSDILLFVGEAQTVSGKEYLFANMILDLAKTLRINLVYTFAAFATKINYNENPKVWGVGTDKNVMNIFENHDVKFLLEGQISGLNGLLLGIGKKRGIPGVCLLGEIPYYTTQMENPKAVCAILQLFSAINGIELELRPLKMQSTLTEQGIKNYLEKSKLVETSEENEENEEDEEDEKDEKPPQTFH